ncbi:MAG: alkaline phosphatase family protein [Bryobacteraceae bacterium]
MRRRIWVLALALVLTWAAGPARGAEKAAERPAKPKLVLAVVIDQFRYDYLTRFRADYHAGLARLLNEGAVYTEAHYIHFPTVTAVGHSTFLTGATPSLSGIVGNEWYDRALKKQVTSVSDETTKLVGGAAGASGSSPRRLLVSTFPDELKMAARGGPQTSRVIGISIKDRAAILPAGHMADAAYWFDDGTNHFVTSDYYMSELPAWVKAVNEAGPTSKYRDAAWMPLNAKPDDKPFCTLATGGAVPSCGSIEATPFGNEMLEAFAEKAVANERLGRHEGTDVLALSFSSNDYAGHRYGPDHPAIRDISIRTDIALGKLLDFIDAQIGKGRTLVVLTADHGVAPEPEVNEARRMNGGRIDGKQLPRVVNQALSERFGEGKWIESDSGGGMYLNYETAARNKADLREVRRVAAEALRAVPHIARVFTHDELMTYGGAADLVGQAVVRGYYAARSGDITMVQEPYYLFGGTSGTSHSTPYSYDTHVPVIFYGAGVQAGVYRRRIAPNDIAPTLASMFNVETPSGAFGEALREVVK